MYWKCDSAHSQTHICIVLIYVSLIVSYRDRISANMCGVYRSYDQHLGSAKTSNALMTVAQLGDASYGDMSPWLGATFGPEMETDIDVAALRKKFVCGEHDSAGCNACNNARSKQACDIATIIDRLAATGDCAPWYDHVFYVNPSMNLVRLPMSVFHFGCAAPSLTW